MLLFCKIIKKTGAVTPTQLAEAVFTFTFTKNTLAFFSKLSKLFRRRVGWLAVVGGLAYLAAYIFGLCGICTLIFFRRQHGFQQTFFLAGLRLPVYLELAVDLVDL